MSTSVQEEIDFPYVGGVVLFLINESNEILLGKRCNTNFMDGYWGMPAGRLDGNETVREGCAREAHEEVGIRIDPQDLEVVHVSHRKTHKDERIDFFMITKKYIGEIENGEPHKCEELQWFPINELPENTIDYMLHGLAEYRAGRTYSEFGF